MTLREAFDRCLPNEKGERVITGTGNAGDEFMSVEMEDGTISFWQMRGVGKTEKMFTEEPEGVDWKPKRSG